VFQLIEYLIPKLKSVTIKSTAMWTLSKFTTFIIESPYIHEIVLSIKENLLE